MTISDQVRPGLAVRSEDGVEIGQVASVGDGQFTVERMLQPALTLPFTAVRTVEHGRVILTMPSSMLRESARTTTQASAPFTRDQVHRGMDVVDSHAEPIGSIVEIRDDDFLVDRPLARSVYVPFDVIRGVSRAHVALQIPAGQVDNMGWPGI
ncbi:MAG TPA: hypothetical protein VFI42_10250 [Thermomicrobiaceae bacterium]|nr:hypothetical protein [Thermomicrobiaceae bacterium]